MKFEFCAHSARLLRKLDHVLLWILSTNTLNSDSSVSVQGKENFNDQQCFAIRLCPALGPSQASSSQNSNVENFQPLKIVFEIIGTLPVFANSQDLPMQTFFLVLPSHFCPIPFHLKAVNLFALIRYQMANHFRCHCHNLVMLSPMVHFFGSEI